MKETIYTIPINDCFNENDSECPICIFESKEEKDRIDYTLGASMMEPDSRIYTNERGFCVRHMSMLYSHGNRLSLDLVLQTHIDEILKNMEKQANEIDSSKNKMFSSKDGVKAAVEGASKSLNNTVSACAVCEKLDYTMDKFVSNIFHMLLNDDEFNKKFFSSKGFCMKHFALLIEKSVKYIPQSNLKEFILNLYKLQNTNLKRIYDDVDWFAKKHDYRFQHEDWKTSKDAVERASAKASSYLSDFKD